MKKKGFLIGGAALILAGAMCFAVVLMKHGWDPQRLSNRDYHLRDGGRWKDVVHVVVEDRNSNFVNDLAVLPVEGVYWLGEAGSKEMSKKLICDLDEKEIQGLCVVSSYDDEETTSRFSAIRINGFYFGVVFDE